MSARLLCGEALEEMAKLPDSSVDLICTDPPYYKVKNEPWDRAWAKPEAFIEWIGRLCAEWQRLLRPNGSLYVFASPRMAARVEVEVGRWFEVLNHLVWSKDDNGSRRHAAQVLAGPGARAFFPDTERIIFAEHHSSDNIAKGEAQYVRACDELRGFVFEPLRAYLDGERERCGVSRQDVNAALGNQMAGHYFSRVQWALPTRPNYEALRALFNSRGGDYLKREYDDLKAEYDDLKAEYDDLKAEYESLRRPFAVTADVPYTDVWTFPTVSNYPGKHPCEKPLEMMEHIIRASSREGATVLDCFMGSGTTGVAAARLGREFIGIDFLPKWVDRARERIEEAPLFAESG